MLKIIVSAPREGEIQPVVWNYDEVRTGVAEKLELYKGRAYTPDTIRGAKADRAALNKLRDAVADARRSKKEEYLKPFHQFEAQCKEIEGMIADTGAAIDSQIKAFEAEEAAKKRESIQLYYDGVIGGLRQYLPFDSLWNDRWQNKTYSMKMIQEEIDRNIEIVTADLNTIRRDCGIDAEACIAEYLATQHNLNRALDKHHQLEELRGRERVARLEALKNRLMAGDKTPPAGAETAAPPPAVSQPAAPAVPAADLTPSLKHMDFRVWYYDKADLMALREFLQARGLRFGKVPVMGSPKQ